MSDQALLGVIAAIALAFQAQAGWTFVSVIRLPAGKSFESLCTGVDLNIGCQPADPASQQPASP